ncbi:MAG: marR-type protein [Cyanobacteriota bacterium erpe_2018_sw_21hr_WHONDRS-SW48-000092_B_bin.40]|jgi:predicted transcriptional regulator|nr:marR-type protein [Cyanobacteriota bacterium erpe_2018_sw_21hr_WHONDRS-SW48-000092_B_bin.40]
MEGRHQFFEHVIKSNLTGEQLRVLICMLTAEYDGIVGIKQNEIAEMLDIAESNVSRSIKALIEAELFRKKEAKGFDGRPIWQVNPVFRKAFYDNEVPALNHGGKAKLNQQRGSS